MKKILIVNQYPSWLLALLVFALINVSFFYSHYLGKATFPWDFWGGYHAMAYAWLRDGSLISPPLYFPYANFGFPTVLAMQSSAFYMPLIVFDWMGFSYTLHAATIVQCLHILVGSMGVYCLLRLNGIGVLSSITGGVFYHLSSGFFSNAQHLDIIRGYALLPWFLVACSRNFLVDYRRIALSAWLIFLFMAGSYPGIIIALFYSLPIYFIHELLKNERAGDKKEYILFVVFSGVLAMMLLTWKYLPLVFQFSEIEADKTVISNGIDIQNYLTAFFRFDLDFIPGDITMRSLYLPPIVFILLFLLNKINKLWLYACLMAIVMLLFVTEGPVRQLMMSVPGFTASRFPISDFRGLVHIALIIMACVALHQMSTYGMLFSRYSCRIFTVFLLVCLLIYVAFVNGYDIKTSSTELIMLILSLLVMILALPYFASKRIVVKTFAYISVWIVALVSTYTYVGHKDITWRFSSYKHDLGSDVYHRDLEQLFSVENRKSFWSLRPERTFYENNKYIGNLGYYTQDFSQSGYDNGLRLKRILEVQKKIKEDHSGNLRKFLSQESRFIITEHLPLNPEEICIEKNSCNDKQSEQIAINEFGLSHIDYQLNLPHEMWLLENELYFPGWQSKICVQGDCFAGPRAMLAMNSLRAWRLPKGQFILHTFYMPPFWMVSKVVFFAALFVSFLLFFVKRSNSKLLGIARK